MKKIHLVMGITGERGSEDRYKWIVAGYTDEQEAISHKQLAQKRANEWQHVIPEGTREWDTDVAEEYRNYDPLIQSYPRTGVHYMIETTSLRERAPV